MSPVSAMKDGETSASSEEDCEVGRLYFIKPCQMRNCNRKSVFTVCVFVCWQEVDSIDCSIKECDISGINVTSTSGEGKTL